MTLYSQTYNWEYWYTYVKQGAAAINSANPDVLIFLSGLDSDTNLSPVAQGTALTPGSGKFSLGDFRGYANKLVLELHNYESLASNCTSLRDELFADGFQALTSSARNQFPVVMTEFGFAENATTWEGVYASCLESYLPASKAGWMIWVLAGSYYVRQGTQDYDESWGLLKHDWSDWRSPEHINGGLIPMVKASLSGVANNQTGAPSNNNSSSRSNAELNYVAGDFMTTFLPTSLLMFAILLLF
jgi:hypothetical protein